MEDTIINAILTSEDFARVRAELRRRINEIDISALMKAREALREKLENLDKAEADLRRSHELAAYHLAAALSGDQAISDPVVEKPNGSRDGMPYMPHEDALIFAAKKGTLRTLAVELGRSYGALSKHHEVLMKAPKKAKVAEDVAVAVQEMLESDQKPDVIDGDALDEGGGQENAVEVDGEEMLRDIASRGRSPTIATSEPAIGPIPPPSIDRLMAGR